MIFRTLKKELGLLIFCFMCLFIVKKIMFIYDIEVKTNFLITSFLRIFLLAVIYNFFIKEKKDILPLKNSFFLSFLIILVIYFSFTNTLDLIDQRGVNEDRSLHIIFIFKCFVTGFFEEILFRIVLFNALLKSNFFITKNSVFKSYLLIAAIFGFAHIGNVVYLDFYSVVNQMFLAFGLGIVLQLLLAKYNNILLISSIHSLTNYFGMRNSILLNLNLTESPEVLSKLEIYYNLSFFCFLDILIVIYTYYFLKRKT